MNATVAVALITALSTLAGASIAGIISLRISKGQVQQQSTLAQAEFDSRRKTERRTVRRDAYAQFLARADQVHRRLSNSFVLMVPGEDRATAIETIDNLLSLDAAADIVDMEGPTDVGAAAQKLRGPLFEEGMLWIRTLQEHGVSRHDPLMKHAADDFNKLLSSITDARRNFVDAAKRALEQDAP